MTLVNAALASVHVRGAFAVRVRGQVQRHAVDENGEVGSMVEIEAAQESRGE
jgi:hypothetical protein